MSGGKYLLGEYDTERQKFVVTNGGDFNFGSWGPNGVHAPSAFPDGKGGVIVIFNMNEGKPTEGWNRLMSLPRRLTLNPEGYFNPLYIEPAGNIESLRRDSVIVDPMNLPANKEVVLKNVEGNTMELVAEIAPQKGQTVELNVLRSPGGEEVTRIICMRDRGYRLGGSPPCVVSLDGSRSSLASDVSLRPPENAQVELADDEPLKLRIFIDKSILEVFINGKQCIAMRVYPERDDSISVSLRSQGKDAKLNSIVAYQMANIYK
jgi:beta-fructofuranosidase